MTLTVLSRRALAEEGYSATNSSPGAEALPSLEALGEQAAAESPPAARKRRPRIVEVLRVITGRIAHPFGGPTEPELQPLPDETLLPQAHALRDIVNHVAKEFQQNPIPYNRPALIETIRRFIPDAANYTSVRDRFLNQSWAAPRDLINQAFGLVDASAATYQIPDNVVAVYLRERMIHMTDAQLLTYEFEKRYHHPVFVEKMQNLIDETTSKEVTLIPVCGIWGRCIRQKLRWID
ncbi:hypothetical protein HDU89_002706 [Geranomyces variabilis]|nr:hypothetical protein HDU89_002706 [Geranomyces variabilis]